ncbi:hypothetical protein [Acaryochloris sp. IP29b_bin.148]|uniref:hypothetical protein n=1 Tax=Acaryochloris sp. IP29b_bin.148 TaxID=2969218 RepID=UPI002608932A|nr:hypothetical protein [Acaryochloris sp. IP29b_bin.148]
MMNTKGLLPTALLFGSVVSTSALLQVAPAHAGTLVTCGPNGAASIVKIVPAGCRHLSATSAPKSSPDNPVKDSRLGFTFKASAPESRAVQPIAAEQDTRNTKDIAALQQR